ncbi:DUF2892 domain-containing protein [Fodinisporobacter ferrooxydans]|uniref:DUF2892 domain-containing protein n=1 Tax=Fodinisporobacter ferrooxydans TaxID=2901836 RepID=A0ABY4CVT6_9BACL|nr:DUF2892 domain-containing protein [Alicyclobacillaceae bacterium MYW30-H2]
MSILPPSFIHSGDPADDEINERIREKTRSNLYFYAGKNDQEIARRIQELEHEWSIERAFEVSAASVVTIGALLGLRKKRWQLASGIAGYFLLQHAIKGWCPPLSLLRRFGVRTAQEISEETFALKAMRGDFLSTEHAKDMYSQRFQ